MDRPTGAGFLDLARATAHLEPPYAVIDLGALRANAADLVRRGGGKPIRVASKSVRCRSILRSVLEMPGFEGILAYTLPEALWLADEFDDIVVAYPTADRDALKQLAGDPVRAARVTLMIDSVEHLDYIEAAVGPSLDAGALRICIDLDASLELLGGKVHLGAYRSPIREAAAAVELATAVQARRGFRLVGLMAYEGQIAGVGDNAPGSVVRRTMVRAMQRTSRAELAGRRAAIVSAVREVALLEFVNGGGTGSLETTSAEEAITETAAGSGLYGPALFDTYRSFQPRPAAFFVLSVVRRPGPGIATVLGGGWIASGAAGKDRLPTPAWPTGLALTDAEGAGEVQTPLTGDAADGLSIGSRVWFRHTKAGELCEHVDALHLVEGSTITETVPTYRGEGRPFL